MPKGVYIRTEEGKRNLRKALMGKIMPLMSEECKRKISLARIGIKFSKKHKLALRLSHLGKSTWNKGKTNIYSKETIEKMVHRGKDNHWWQGGKSFEVYPLGWNKTFKEQIRYRDGYKCQLCGCPEAESIRKLDVHHIDYNKKNINLNNLITLCRNCHIKTNYNHKYWRKLWVS